MNYYEELGIQPDATAGQIHQAYKTLVRLLHPDSHTDEAVKAVAELQMRRLNGMLDTLLDPERRRVYDESLSKTGQPRKLAPPPEIYETVREDVWQQLVQGALRQWSWILIGLLMAGTTVWYIAYKDSGPAEVAVAALAPVPPNLPAQPSSTAVSQPAARAARPAPDGMSRETPETRGVDTGTAPSESPIPNSDLQRLEGGAALPTAGPEPVRLPAAPVRVAGEPESPPANLRGPDAGEAPTLWAGNWLYAPRAEDRPEAGLYAPAYIELLLVEEHGNLAGKYRARYRVPDKALSSEVGFRAEGRAQSGNSATLAWTSDEGAKGTVELVLSSSDLLKVTWWTTALGRRAGLTSGTATLVRQRMR